MGLLSKSKTTKKFLSDDTVKKIVSNIETFQETLLHTSDLDKEYHEFAKLVNNFFSETFNVHYKFTYEDLKLELKDKNLESSDERKLDELCDNMSELEFDKSKLSKEKLLDLSANMIEIANNVSGKSLDKLVPIETKKENKQNSIEKLDIEFKAFNESSKNIQENKFEINKMDPEKDETGKTLFSKLFKNIKVPSIKKKSEKKIPTDNIKLTKLQPSGLPSFDITNVPKPPSALSLPKKEIKNAKNERKKSSSELLKESEDLFSKEAPVLRETNKYLELNEIKVPKTETKKLKKSEKKAEKLQKELTKIDSKIKPSEQKKIDEEKAKIKKELTEAVSEIKESRKNIKEKVDIIKEERKVLAKHKDILEQRLDLGKNLPKFKVEKLDDEIQKISARETELKQKETEISGKLESLKLMEKNLKEFSETLNKNEKFINKKAESVATQEANLKEIKSELTQKYSNAMKEIEGMRSYFKEKERAFLVLQKYFQKRENKLSVEEGNLLSEKKHYKNIVSNLVEKHLTLAYNDIDRADYAIEDLKRKNKNADEKIISFEKAFKELIDRKKRIDKLLKSRTEYFDTLEKEFKSREKEFEKSDAILQKEKIRILEKEAALVDFEKNIMEAREKVKRQLQMFELKELDIKTLDKNLDSLKFSIKSKENRINIKTSQVERRIDSYIRLKNHITRHLAIERTAIKRLERKLRKKGSLVDNELDEIEYKEQGLDKHHDKVFGLAKTLKRGEAIHARTIEVEHQYPDMEPGNPDVLDILKMLNIAKENISQNRDAEARNIYMGIQKVFENLNEDERLDIEGEINSVFKKRDLNNNNLNQIPTNSPTANESENLDHLIEDFRGFIDRGDMEMAQKVYDELQNQYSGMGKETKAQYYNKIMDIYNTINSANPAQ